MCTAILKAVLFCGSLPILGSGFGIGIVMLSTQQNVAAVIALTIVFTGLMVFSCLYCAKRIFARRMEHYKSTHPVPQTPAMPARMIFEWIGVTLGIAIAICVLLWGLKKYGIF